MTKKLLFVATLIGMSIVPAAGAEQVQTREERLAAREQARFRAMDVDKDGTLTRREWRDGAAAFRKRDTNRDGVLSGTEVWTEATIDQARENDPRARTPGYRSGYDRGMIEGRQAGKEDKELRNQWDLEGQRELEQADSGYTAQIGLREDYQAGYRAGFRLGYRQGFGPR